MSLDGLGWGGVGGGGVLSACSWAQQHVTHVMHNMVGVRPTLRACHISKYKLLLTEMTNYAKTN